ncbi:MAG: acyl-CoA synthetase [Myxococcota bacterium]|nr:acyl-CoA synthetase [Spirochaeta sp.]RPG05327.1 MAG: acyl-CoA synthetase [Proteobacteria bacterium TMED72]
MEKHYATIWESITDVIGDREALVHGENRLTWSQYDNRASRMAQALTEAGLGADSKIGLYLYNSNEYLEAQYAGMKIRGVPINVNYRYLDDELLYLLDNSDAEALFFHSSLGDRVARVMERAKKVRVWIQVDDGGESVPGAVAYEDLIAAHDPAARIKRADDDLYMLYTGGTTGMPKGVMYDIGAMVQFFMSLGFPILGLGNPEPKEVASVVKASFDEGRNINSIPACPLMHGTGMWLGAFMPHLAGGKVITLPSRSLDSSELWQSVQDEKATQVVIVGDAFAKPMLKALEEAKEAGRPYDLSSVGMIISSGVMWTTEVKQAMLEWHGFMLIDAMGSTEGSMGMQVTTRGNVGETARFSKGENTKVFTEDGREVEPGSGEAGMVAAGGTVPRGYYKDEEKSAATFKTINGVRYSFPGDWALVEADGTLTLLGRGSNCINTAGEKVYPEEVEEAVKQHDDVVDCLVVGVEDEKFGQRVTAVASLIPESASDADAVREFTRTKLAAYKVPKQILIVDQVKRAPNGKADYKWAKNQIESQ